MTGLRMFLTILGEGLSTTLWVFFITLVVSLPLAVPIAIMRLSDSKLISFLTGAYIYIMRGTPLMLQLMFVYFGLPSVPVIGVSLSRGSAIALAFILNYTAYLAEILRGGILSIPPGQWEAGKVLGLSRSYTFLRIILPQAIKNVLPSISNEVITLVKDTSLVYVLGVTDVMKVAKATSNTAASFAPYLYAGFVYLALIAILTQILNQVEKRARGVA